MALELGPVRRGPKWMRDAFERRDQYALQTTPLQASGTSLIQSKAGTGIKARGRRGGGNILKTPWQITVSKINGVWYVSVRPGSVNSLVPWNIFTPIPISNGTWYVKIKCDTDGKTPNYITVMVNNSATESALTVAENVAPPIFFDVLGIVVQSTSATGSVSNQIFQIRNTNLTATPTIRSLVSRTPPNVGDEPFVRWYQWQLATS